MLRQMVWPTCAKLVAIDMAVWDRKSNLLINEIAFMLFVFTSSKTAHGALCVLNDARYVVSKWTRVGMVKFDCSQIIQMGIGRNR